jgi:hypothetical protein
MTKNILGTKDNLKALAYFRLGTILGIGGILYHMLSFFIGDDNPDKKCFFILSLCFIFMKNGQMITSHVLNHFLEEFHKGREKHG